MIKTKRTECPVELSDEVKERLTEEYKTTGNSVWKKKYIKDNLLNMSNSKCCFCEMKLDEEGKYMQVEHFHYKSKYPDEVVDWNNLLPSCNRCNFYKGTHDTIEDPIIDPCVQTPTDYLYMENYRLKSKNNNSLANTTIDVLYLNDSDRLVYPRFIIGEQVHELIQQLNTLFEVYSEDISNVKNRNKVISCIRRLLLLAQSDKEYSATVATVIATDDVYNKLKLELIESGIWSEEIEQLDRIVNMNALVKSSDR